MAEPVPLSVWFIQRSVRLWHTAIDPWAEKVGRPTDQQSWVRAGALFVAGSDHSLRHRPSKTFVAPWNPSGSSTGPAPSSAGQPRCRT
jgi:hypothetical protein